MLWKTHSKGTEIPDTTENILELWVSTTGLLDEGGPLIMKQFDDKQNSESRLEVKYTP